jgi:hypothetical protein
MTSPVKEYLEITDAATDRFRQAKRLNADNVVLSPLREQRNYLFGQEVSNSMKR